jgi:glyoxylase I family protein
VDATHLGVAEPPPSYEICSWWQQEGATGFAPMGPGSDHLLGGPQHSCAINFRVADLDAMVAQLTAAGNRGRGRPGDLSERAFRKPG